MKMSFRYHFNNAVASVFEYGDSALKTFVVAATAICLPVYTASELVLSDASAMRTPVSGDEQVQALDKTLSQLVTFTRDGKAKMQELNNLRAQQAADPNNAALTQKLGAMEQQQAGLETALQNGKKGFAYSVVMSEGISEVDARKLVGRYQDHFGDPDLYAVRASSPGTLGLHSFAYLDECQNEVMAGKVYETADAANDIDRCMYSAADNHSLGALMAGIVGGLPAGLALMTFLSGVGSRCRTTATKEHYNYLEKMRDGADKKKPAKTDEFSLKIKIQKPKV